MKATLTCPECGCEWTIGYWKWTFTAPFHIFKLREFRDYRRTKCPMCKKKSWIKRA